LLTYIAVVVLAMVASKTPPTLNKAGAVLVDPFANALTILASVGGFATTAFAYWFASVGKEKAEVKAAQSQGALTYVAAKSKGDGGALNMEDLQSKFPKAFGLKG
jgi:hypothetical protein